MAGIRPPNLAPRELVSSPNVRAVKRLRPVHQGARQGCQPEPAGVITAMRPDALPTAHHVQIAESAWLNTVPALAGRRTQIIQLGACQRLPKSGFGHVIVYGGSWPGGQDSLASAGLADAMRPVALALGGRAGPGLRARRDDGGKIPVGLGRGHLAKCRRACRWATRISARG